MFMWDKWEMGRTDLNKPATPSRQLSVYSWRPWSAQNVLVKHTQATSTVDAALGVAQGVDCLVQHILAYSEHIVRGYQFSSGDVSVTSSGLFWGHLKCCEVLLSFSISLSVENALSLAHSLVYSHTLVSNSVLVMLVSGFLPGSLQLIWMPNCWIGAFPPLLSQDYLHCWRKCYFAYAFSAYMIVNVVVDFHLNLCVVHDCII